MPKATSLQEFLQAVSDGPALQFEMNSTALGIATTIGATSTVVSNVIGSQGYNQMVFGAKSDQAGVMTVQPYVDTTGLITQGPPVTAALVGGTTTVLNTGLAQIGAPFQSFKLSLSNTSAGGPATVSSLIALLQGGALGADSLLIGNTGPISSTNPVPITGRVATPVKIDGTTGASGWNTAADLTGTPAYLELQNKGTATLVIQIGGATGGDTTGAVENIAAGATYFTPDGLLVNAKFFTSAGATAASLPYGGWKG